MRNILITLIGLVVLVGSALAGGVWYINSSGHLESWIEAKLSNPENDVKVRVADASMTLNLSAHPIQISTKDINIFVPEQTITLPKAQFTFDIFDLVSDQPIPRSITLDGLAFAVEYDANGWHTGASFAALVDAFIPDSAAFNNSQPEQNIDKLSSDFRFPVEKLTINNGKITVLYPSSEADETNVSLNIDGIMINIESVNNEIRADLKVDHPELGNARLDASISPDFELWDIAATLNQFDSGLFYPYIGVNIPELHDLGKISGNVRLSLSERSVDILSGDIEASNGKIIVPSIGIVNFTDATSEFHYDKSIDRLRLISLSINAPESSAISGQISLSGELREASTSSPVLIASLMGSQIPLQPILTLMPDYSWLQHDEHGQMFRGGKIDDFELETIASINRDNDQLLFKTFSLTSSVRNIKFVSGYGTVDRISGILDGQFNFILGADGKVDRADTHLLLRDSSLLPEQGGKIIPLKGLEFIAKLNGTSLEIDRLAVDANAYGQMALRGKVTMDSHLTPSVFETQIQAEQLDNELIMNLWPDQLFTRTRSWIKSHIDGGQVESFYLSTGLDLKEDNIKPLFIEGDGIVSAPRFKYLLSHKPITDAEIGISFEGTKLAGTTFELNFNKGILNGLNVTGSKLSINRKDEVANAALSIMTRGDFAVVAEVLDEPKFRFLSANGLSPNDVAGMIDITGSIKWQLQKTSRIMTPDEFDIKISASMEDAAISGLPGGYVLSDSIINLQYNNNDIRLNGRGRINDANANFYLHRDRQNNHNIDLTFAKTAAFTSLINRSFPLDLGGAVGGQIYMSYPYQGGDLDLNVNLDLGDAYFYIPRLELTKLEGERAVVSAEINIGNGNLRSIRNIKVDADVIRVEGNASFDADGMFSKAILSVMEWPGNVLTDAVFQHNEDGSFALTADAEVMDLRPFRLKESPGEGLEMKLDLSAERLILDHRLSVAGSVVIETRVDGSGEANFLGNLSLKDKPFMTEATMRAQFGNNGDEMEATGLIGGVEASLSLQSGAADGDYLVLTTHNAGQILKTLQVTDAIRGGKMTMNVLYEPDDADHYVANFAVTDFRVIEAPRAIRMLSVLSLAGLYSLVEGDGTAFTEGQATIFVTPDVQKLDMVKARGDALAIELTGQINRKDDSLNISGVIVPIYLITELIGNLPIIGEIITGINNDGVFNTRFRMKGTIDDPNIDVRLSSIAPGLLRDIFSPDWINNERSRLQDEN